MATLLNMRRCASKIINLKTPEQRVEHFRRQ